METTITLYRGDAERIKRFEFKKTCKYSYVGQGIYLTDRKATAETYREKDSSELARQSLFLGEAKNRTHAFELAFQNFRSFLVDYCVPSTNKKIVEADYAMYKSLIEDGSIVANYTTLPAHQLVKGTRLVSITTARAHAKHKAQQQPRLEVIYHTNKTVGFLTSFEFPKNLIDNNTILIDGTIKDRGFWELMYDNKIDFGTPYSDREQYIEINSSRSSSVIGSVTSSTFDDIRKVLQPYGILGFEYKGGVNTGSSKHRAFCIWDEEFVNRHKVKTSR